MKNKVIFFLISSFFIFIFLIFYKGLNQSNLYQPKSKVKNVPQFSIITFYEQKEIHSKNIFNQNKYYLLNIWASWCMPCRDEHPILLNLSNNFEIEIIGMNYKDNFKNAKKFLDELGNPYTKILVDKDGTRSIELGAIGVPESFLIYKNDIVRKFIGPLNIEMIKEIEKIIQ